MSFLKRRNIIPIVRRIPISEKYPIFFKRLSQLYRKSSNRFRRDSFLQFSRLLLLQMYYIVSYFKILKILLAVDFLLNIEFDPEREMYSRKKLLALSQIIIQIWWNEMCVIRKFQEHYIQRHERFKIKESWESIVEDYQQSGIKKNLSWLRCAKFFIWKEVAWFFEQVKAEKKSRFFFLSQFYRRSRRIVNGPCFPLSFSPFRIEREVDRSSRIASFPGSNRSTSSRVRLSKPVQRSRFLFFETTKRYHPDRGKY